MNTNPNAKRILCYGDSNTFGVIPGTKSRYEADKRWPGILQGLLGNDYEIIEEGLPGRTTNINDPFPGYEDKNGLDYIFPCIRSQVPLDLVFLMLGTNDLKEIYKREAGDIAKGIKSLIDVIKEYSYAEQSSTKIIILCPPHVLKSVEEEKPHFKGASEKSVNLSGELEKLATETGCEFFDTAKIVKSSEVDGLHLDEDQHEILAQSLLSKIKNV